MHPNLQLRARGKACLVVCALCRSQPLEQQRAQTVGESGRFCGHPAAQKAHSVCIPLPAVTLGWQGHMVVWVAGSGC